MTNLCLIRHGEAVVNTTYVVGGMRGDTGLTSLGVVQAERLHDRLADTGEIAAGVLISSTRPRARQTAEIIAPALDLPLTLDDDVQELRPGDADGLPLQRWNHSEAWHLAFYNDSTHLRDLNSASRIPWATLSAPPRGGPDAPAIPVSTEATKS